MTEQSPEAEPTFPRLYVPPEDVETAQAAAEFTPATTLPFSFRTPRWPNDPAIATGTPDPSYLVLLESAIGDYPLGLFHDRDEAVEFAREVRDNPTAHADHYFDTVVRRGITGIFCQPRWLSVSVVEFAGATPTGTTLLFNLE